jgi:hypothetical protein
LAQPAFMTSFLPPPFGGIDESGDLFFISNKYTPNRPFTATELFSSAELFHTLLKKILKPRKKIQNPF